MKIQPSATGLKLIRHQYSPDKKRGTRVVVATLPHDTRKISAEIALLLREAELPAVQAYLDNLRCEEERMAGFVAAKNLPDEIAWATRYYLCPTYPIANLASVAAQTRDAYSGLLNAMVKAGVGRKRNRARRIKSA